MATIGESTGLAYQARRVYTEELVKGLPPLVTTVSHWAISPERVAPGADPATLMRLRDLTADLKRHGVAWHQGMVAALQHALHHGAGSSVGGDTMMNTQARKLSLVDDQTIEREITASRLALAVMDRAGEEFNDLRARVALLERREELDPNDLLRSHVLARFVVDAWAEAGLPDAALRDLQPVLHEEFATLVQEAYHEANSVLVAHNVMADIDLRPLIRRTRGGSTTGYGSQAEETRLMTRSGVASAPSGPPGSADNATAVLTRLTRMIEHQVPAFAHTAHVGQRTVSPGLSAAIGSAQVGVQRRLSGDGTAQVATVSPALLEELQARKQALKRAAESPVERATIEIVALLFQAILTEERIPASVRVWFARLQMPVLRVAVGEPDFFATIDHPARRLIDRMGACVMGFEATARAVSDALETEIKRIVQVVEAYPDTGRRVFQTVLTEFERFLENYFKSDAATRKGVSLAQQVEQRETLAIQYTIELRKLLNEVPVQEGRAPVPVPGLGRRDGRHLGAQRCPKRGHQGHARGGRRPDLVGRGQGHARGARRGDPQAAAAAEEVARGHGVGGRAGRQARRACALAQRVAGRGVLGQGGRDPARPLRGTARAAGDAGGAVARCRRRAALPDPDARPFRRRQQRARSGRRGRFDAHAGHAVVGA